MAKYYGKIGYAESRMTALDVYEDTITERSYTGEILQNIRRWETGEHLNDDLNVSNRISIIADPYAYQHLGSIKYVTWMNIKWKVKSVEVQEPHRLVLTIGGIYNEQSEE